MSIENVDYGSTISPVALVDIHPLLYECGINELLKIILNSMQNFNALP